MSKEMSFGETVVFWLIFAVCMLVINASMDTVHGEEFRDPMPGLDMPIETALVGTWEEIGEHGKYIVTYQPDNTFEQTYYLNGQEYKTQGVWMVRGGHIYYKDEVGTTSIRVFSVNKNNTLLVWPDGEICEGNRFIERK